MYHLNFIIVFGAVFSLYLGMYILLRGDIGYRKINTVLLLMIIFLAELSLFIVSEIIFTTRCEIWRMIFFTLFLDVQMFLPALILEKYIRKPFYSMLYPPVVLIISVLAVLSFKSSFSVFCSLLCNTHMFNHPAENMLNAVSYTFLTINAFSIVISALSRRWLISVIPMLIIVSFLLDLFFTINSQLNFSGAAVIILSIYFPLAVFLDFMKVHRHRIIQRYSSDEILDQVPFGIIIPFEKGVYMNRFMREMLENEDADINEWTEKNISDLRSQENDYFIERNMDIGSQSYHFSIMKKTYRKYMRSGEIYIVFNYTNVKIIEKMSKDYTNFVVTSLMDKIYQYNLQVQYNKMFEFLKGFSHNSFSMISVLKAGFEYILDSIEYIETNLYTAKSMAKMKEDVGGRINTIQKTLGLTNTGLVSLQESFKILNNKIKYESVQETSVFGVNDLIEQELFFYVLNTQYKYTINIEKNLSQNLRDIEFNYKILSSIFNNIVLYTISELATSHIKHILVKTFATEDGSICIRIEGSVTDFDSKKIDDILNKSLYTDNEGYADLINAFLMAKSTGSVLRRVDSQNLVFEIVINE